MYTPSSMIHFPGNCRPYAYVAASEPWNHLVCMKLICILRLKLNGPGEVVVKPSFSISELSFLITAAENDQSITFAEVTTRANGMKYADSNTTVHCFETGWSKCVSFLIVNCFALSLFATFAELTTLDVDVHPSNSSTQRDRNIRNNLSMDCHFRF